MIAIEQETSRGTGAAVLVNPLEYPGWDGCVARTWGGSVFHSSGWARTLVETYGHSPCYLARFGGEGFEELLPLMEVSSAWTGKRGVGLAFTDLCDPLPVGGKSLQALFDLAVARGRGRGWRYLEVRGSGYDWLPTEPSVRFFGHTVDLEAGAEVAWGGLAPAVRRSVRKAERSGLKVSISQEPAALEEYYGLHCLTRRRHGIPPQPQRFFANLGRHVIGAGHGFVVTARTGSQAIASAVFLHLGNRGVYKYGASDLRHQALRANDLVMWKAIAHAAELGLGSLHLGRTSLFHEGLRRFKLGFGAREEFIHYYRYDFGKAAFVPANDLAGAWFNRCWRCLPSPLLRLAGRWLYPHLS